MIVVTGGAGFIGSNLVKALNEQGREDILVVDNLKDGSKFRNIVDCSIADYMDKQDFIEQIKANKKFPFRIEFIFHQGACSKTTEWDGRYMMENNYEYSKCLLNYCEEHSIDFVYASSAAVYGSGSKYIEDEQYERPINVYGYSKYLFDQHVRKKLSTTRIRIIGLRYFNVYGPGEFHKQSMASVAFHLNNQLAESGVVRLFAGSDGYDNGEQRRDFIYVKDVIKVNLWGMEKTAPSGIYNVGTGKSRSFNDVANAVINYHQRGSIEYIEFPEHLKTSYQSFTEADPQHLLNAGYAGGFISLEDGVEDYMNWLNQQN